MSKCPPNYKNLNEIQSFSEQSYATKQWAEQNCENDEYLFRELEELGYLTPPAVRKRFCPILLDDVKSYGCQINDDKSVTFSSLESDEIIIDFTNFKLIDESKSDCAYETYNDNNVQHQMAVVPKEETSTVDYRTRTITNGQGTNSFWYVGYDKGKAYQVRPDWLKNEFDTEIPSVCRAQTITIAQNSSNQDIINGYWESVDLKLENMGVNDSNWGSPLYVQIWPTKKVKVEKTKWNKKKKRAESYSPKQYEYIYKPKGNPKKPLAQAVYQPDKTTPEFHNFKFDKAIKVNTGEHYAIVLLSPLSHSSHCPRWGGWGRNCKRDQKYPGGDAWLSENNGKSWIRYGRNDLNVKYKFGKLTPQDFAFQCHIREYTNGYDTNEDFFLYLKPIFTNPIKKVTINPDRVYGNENDPDINLIFEVSPSGKEGTWVIPNESMNVIFQPTSTGDYPRMCFIRARMSTTSPDKTPNIEHLIVTLTMDRPSEMYARTLFYYPKLDSMLGASLWGRVYAPFTAEPSVTGSVEIIQDRLVTEHFDIITAQELEEYTWIQGLDIAAITDEDLDVRYHYLIDNPNALSLLKAKNVYVKPYTYVSGNKTVTDMMSFQEGIQFTNSPASPIVDALLQPTGTEPVESFAEYIDYNFDYDNDVLKFNNVLKTYVDGGTTVTEGVESIPTGTLAVSYNPIFIQDLTSNEVGLREDGEGLILDYFKETFIIGDEELENRCVKLRVSPVDPIRKLTLNDIELREDIDFTVDYTAKTVNFPVENVDEVSTRLNSNDELIIVYTPNLEDVGIAIGYRAKRTNTDKEMIIKENYIEYKV